LESFGTFLLMGLTLMLGGEIVVCYTWDDETIFDNGAETGSNRFVTGGVDLEVFSEIAGFNFRINQIIIFLLNEKDCSLLMVKHFYPNS